MIFSQQPAMTHQSSSDLSTAEKNERTRLCVLRPVYAPAARVVVWKTPCVYRRMTDGSSRGCSKNRVDS